MRDFPPPTLTGKDAEKFVEQDKKPLSPEQSNHLKECKDVYDNLSWMPNFKVERMERRDETGKLVDRCFTVEEELRFAKPVAMSKGKKWHWWNERKANKKLAKFTGLEVLPKGR